MPFLNKKSLNRFIGTILIIAILVPSIYLSFPKKTEAQWAVFDVVTEVNTGISAIANTTGTTKDVGLDAIAWVIAKMIIRKITAQTVNWINSGFKGNPAFVTDPSQFFLNVGDTLAGQVLSNSNLSKLCSPFQAQVRLTLVKNYLSDTSVNNTCTLGMIENNFDSFVNNFSNGGWDAFFNVTQNSQNNPYGSYLNTKNELSVKINSQVAKYDKQASWSNGFLSYEKCKPGTEQPPVAGVSGNGTLTTTTSTQCKTWDYSKANADPTKGPIVSPTCKEYYPTSSQVIDSGLAVGDCTPDNKETVTPGSVIETQMENVFGSSIKQLEAADEINEIVSALLNQLIDSLIGGIGNGLRGLTQQTATSPRSYLEQISQGSAETTAEDNKTQTSIDQTVSTYENQLSNSGTGTTTSSATQPFISLVGDNPMNVSMGSTFIDPGANAFDQKSNTTTFIYSTDTVNTNTTGTFTINYNYTSPSGIPADTVYRTVNIIP